MNPGLVLEFSNALRSGFRAAPAPSRIALGQVKPCPLLIEFALVYIYTGLFVSLQRPLVKFAGARKIAFFAVKIGVGLEDLAEGEPQIVKPRKLERALQMPLRLVEFAAV